jgi:hypothetical protein
MPTCRLGCDQPAHADVRGGGSAAELVGWTILDAVVLEEQPPGAGWIVPADPKATSSA